MAYPPRLFVTDKWYHVYTRGQRREPLFFSPTDRLAYLSFLDNELFRRDGVIGSYCLMTNHLHLLIKMDQTPLNEIFQTVHMRYAKYFNNKRHTVGHVFQGRPGMKIVLDNSYLLQLVGYIHKNPVKAGMVDEVRSYDWSSWDWFIGEEVKKLATGMLPPGFQDHTKQVFLDTITTKNDLEGDDNYWGTKEEWESLDRREEGREGRKFRERRGKRDMQSIVKELIDPTEITLEELQSQSRKREISKIRQKAMIELYQEGYNPTEIGKYFNRTPPSVTYALNNRKGEPNK